RRGFPGGSALLASFSIPEGACFGEDKRSPALEWRLSILRPPPGVQSEPELPGQHRLHQPFDFILIGKHTPAVIGRVTAESKGAQSWSHVFSDNQESLVDSIIAWLRSRNYRKSPS